MEEKIPHMPGALRYKNIRSAFAARGWTIQYNTDASKQLFLLITQVTFIPIRAFSHLTVRHYPFYTWYSSRQGYRPSSAIYHVSGKL